jgi:predicted ATPase
VKETGGRAIVESIKAYLQEKRLLLLLDNFEQIVDAAPRIADLLAAAPGLKVLVTSRATLHLNGEHEFAVPPLALPPTNDERRTKNDDRDSHIQAQTISQYAAVALFIQRARAAKADFAVTNANAPAVAEICCRLDGLPLAIELAAARVKLFPAAVLLARLSSPLALLTGGARDLPARHQTLRNTIAWSYGLLSAEEQILFRRLGVFVGGCTLEAAEAVCGVANDLTMAAVDGVASLLDQSLLRRREGVAGEPRFTMLETIREYALEQLATNGEAEALQRRHAEYFVALALEDERFGGYDERAIVWYARRAADIDNLRAALIWSHFAPDRAETLLRLVTALFGFWDHQGAINEARTWIERALAQSHSASTFAQARLFHTAGHLAFQDGDYAHAITFQEQSLHLSQQLGDQFQIARSYHIIGMAMRNLGDLDRSQAAVEEALRLFREVGVAWGIAGALAALGDLAFDRGDYTRASALFQEGLTLGRQQGSWVLVAVVLVALARVASAEGDYDRANSLLEESLDLHRKLGESTGDLAHYEIGKTALLQGNWSRAAALFQDCIAKHIEVQWVVLISLEGLAAAVAAQGGGERAARLWGAAESWREMANAPRDAYENRDYERWVAAARAQFDANTFAAAWAAGRAMTLEQAIAEALDEAPEPGI